MRAAKLEHYGLNSGEAAAYLDISLGHLYNLISQGHGPRHIKYGGQLRFRTDHLDDWISARYVAVGDVWSE
ncbi:MAG: helix-turn-helix domain-containing protein [Planctomycetes bacterium]|nr:helix-turn-helix domain-containing protein [Planctomycetota bacterium]